MGGWVVDLDFVENLRRSAAIETNVKVIVPQTKICVFTDEMSIALQAMSCGTPVIAVRSGGPLETVQK